MKCVEVKENLEAFLDDEIGVILQDEISIHLDICETCRADFAELCSVSSLLKKELPVSPPKPLDDRVIAAFRQHHQKKSAWNWSGIFAGILTPKLAVAALTLCFLTISAFIIGRITAPAQEIIVSSPPQIIEKNMPTEVVKYVEIPTTKYVEVPVEKERIVTRTIYRNIETPRKIESTVARQLPTVDNTESAQQLDLKDFQPLGEISPRIVKKGEIDEK